MKVCIYRETERDGGKIPEKLVYWYPAADCVL